ncbi:MAG: hypothetical protein MR292_00360 [Alistipes sp.]|nr:hypothetical protein [Alistipes sp.]
MRHPFITIAIALAVLAPAAYAAGADTLPAPAVDDNAPVVRGSVEPDSIGIGDRFIYSIEVDKDLVQTVLFPSFGGEGSEAYSLIEDMPIDTLAREGRRMTIRKRYLLGAFEEGIHRVVPQVMYADKNIVDTLHGADTLDLLVTTFQIDSTSQSIYDIKPQKTLPFRMGEITGYIKWVIVALLILAALAYALRRVLAHYGRSLRDMFRPAPPQPPHVVAFAALEKLRAERLWQQDKHKQYYSALTDILRTYLVGQFGVGAMEMTSDEIIEAVRGIDVPQKNAMDLTQMLREADLVKFAKAVPDAEENEAAYRAAWDFVEQTRPEEPEADETAAAATAPAAPAAPQASPSETAAAQAEDAPAEEKSPAEATEQDEKN